MPLFKAEYLLRITEKIFKAAGATDRKRNGSPNTLLSQISRVMILTESWLYPNI